MKDRYEIGDYVTYEREGEEYGIVVSVDAGQYAVQSLSSGKVDWFEPFELEFMSPIKLESKDVLRFVRYEMTFEELTGFDRPYDIVECSMPVIASPKDILNAVNVILKKRISPRSIYKEWLIPLVQIFMAHGELSISRHLFFDEEYVFLVIKHLSDSLKQEDDNQVALDDFLTKLQGLRDNLALAASNIDKDPSEWVFNDETEIVFLKKYLKYKSLDKELNRSGYDEVYEQRLLHQINKESSFGLFVLGYSLVFGLHGRKRNIKKAYEYLLSSYKKSSDNDILFYIGICEYILGNYREAYKHLMSASFIGVKEASMLASDMLSTGMGTISCPETACLHQLDLYKNSVKDIRVGNFDTFIPELTARLFWIYKEGRGTCVNSYMSEYFYLLSVFADKVRNLSHKMYGSFCRQFVDLREFKVKLPKKSEALTSHKSPLIEGMLHNFLNIGLPDGGKYIMHIKPLRNNLVSLSIETLPYDEDKRGIDHEIPFYAELFQPRMFFILPEFRFVGYLDNVIITAKNFSHVSMKPGEEDIVFDRISGNNLLLEGNTVMIFNADSFYIERKFFDTKSAQKYNLVIYERDNKTRGFCLDRNVGRIRPGDSVKTLCGEKGICLSSTIVRDIELNKRKEAFDFVIGN